MGFFGVLPVSSLPPPLRRPLFTFLAVVILLGSRCCTAEEETEITEKLVHVSGVAGGKALLPCNMTPTTKDDEAVLILWYKDESASPLYSIDARRGSIHHSRHVIGDYLSRRAYMDTSEVPAILQVENLREKDDGVYRCRIDFKKSRTRNCDVVLTVIMPPRKPIITDQTGEILQSLIGPYNEGDQLLLICEVEGGKPMSILTWWRESVLLDDTWELTPNGVVRNELLVGQLRRHDLMAVFTCQAANNNISVPSFSSVTVDINFRPVEVTMENEHESLSASRSVDLICKAKGSRPPAVVTWWKGSQAMKRTKDRISIDGYVTTSTLTFTPTSEDNGKYLSCRAENPLIAGSAVETGWRLNVQYVPQMSLRLGSKLNHAHIQENNDVYLECNIRASPWVSEIGWRFEGKELLTNVSSGVIVSNQSLVLQKVQRHNRGYYTCTAINTEGQGESNPVYLRVQYSPTCKPGQKTVYGVARQESVRVFCEVEADPPQMNFRWEFNNSLETVQVLTFLSDGAQSVATYIPRTEYDYGTLLCWSKNSVGVQVEPCIYAVIPAGPPDAPENCTVANCTETSLVLECQEGYDGGLPQFFVMEVHESGQHRVLANVTTDVPLLFVQGLPAGATFVLVIYAVNIKGRSQALVLRANTLPAPFRQTQNEVRWQFNMSPILIILTGVVLVLVLVAVVVVAGMRDKTRKRNDNSETDATVFDAMKKQPGTPKDRMDKVFSTSVAEEKCPDLIPEEKERTSSGVFCSSLTMEMELEISENSRRGTLPDPTAVSREGPALGTRYVRSISRGSYSPQPLQLYSIAQYTPAGNPGTNASRLDSDDYVCETGLTMQQIGEAPSSAQLLYPVRPPATGLTAAGLAVRGMPLVQMKGDINEYRGTDV